MITDPNLWVAGSFVSGIVLGAILAIFRGRT